MARFSSALFLLLLSVHSSSLLAKAPCVRFDVAQTTHASEVSTAEFLAANPDEKLIHVRLPISSLVHLNDESLLVQYLYLISGPASANFQIVDYAPRTTLASDVAGPISVEQSTGDSASVGINATGPNDLPVQATANASRNVSSSNSQRLQQLAPKYLLSASGTMHRGASAYFKLQPSSQTTLEGSKVFEITARVPYNWRAGLLHVHCVSFVSGRGSKEARAVCGENRFVVGVYVGGDEAAKQSVAELVEKQQRLQALAAKQSNVIADRRFPTLGHKLGAALSVTKPKIPEAWLDELLHSNDFHDFERHLPRNVRTAANEYRAARKQVIRFAG